MSQMKEKIKTAAIELFYRKSYFATGVNDIARACGIRKASIYHHYASKEDILLDILKTTMIDLEVNLEQSLDGREGVVDRLGAAIRSHIHFHVQRQKEAIISDSELRALTAINYKIVIKMRDRYEKEFQDLIEQGIREGVFAQRDVKVLSYAILTMCTAVAAWYKSAGRLSVAEVAEVYETLILKGLQYGRIG